MVPGIIELVTTLPPKIRSLSLRATNRNLEIASFILSDL